MSTTINSIVMQENTRELMTWVSNSDYKNENERASTQLTTLLLEWGDEWARERDSKLAVPQQLSECLLSGMQWMDVRIGSSPTAVIRVPLEWDAVNEGTYR